MIFIFAQPPQLKGVSALYQECGLPTEGLDAETIKHVLVCRAEGALAGAAGMEIFGEAGILRPPAVAAAFRGRGIGSLLLVRIERFAALQGVKDFIAAAPAAQTFLAARGYREIAAADIPPQLPLLSRPGHDGGQRFWVKALKAQKVPPKH